MKATQSLAALALFSLLGACAAQKESAPPAMSPAPAEPTQPAAGYPTSAAPPPPPPGTITRTPDAPERSADPLWVEFERLDREIALSTSDCATACRALASLERAAKRVCEGAAQLGEGGRCDEATKRLREARGRVRSACTRCAGGPSTDPDAPTL